MARRKQLPVQNNPLPLLLIPVLTGALKVAAVAAVGATVATAAYSVYVVSEEEERRKDLPRLSEILENNIANILVDTAGRRDLIYGILLQILLRHHFE